MNTERQTMRRVQVEGVDYSPEGIEDLRQELILVRGQAMQQLPDAAGFVVTVTHVIALLADYAELRQLEDSESARCPYCHERFFALKGHDPLKHHVQYCEARPAEDDDE